MNLLSLEQFREILHYNPFHYWGWQNAKVPVTSACNSVVKNYAWQTQNAVGRNEIRQAIQEAESRLRDYLGYSVAPHYTTDDILDYPQLYDKNFVGTTPINAAGFWKAVSLSEGYVELAGVEKLTLLNTINANATFPFTGTKPSLPYLIYLDTDADGLVDTFEISVTTTVTDGSQIAVYFSATDRLDSDMEKWRINPINVSISSGTLTIRGRSWMLGRPILYEGVIAADLNPDTFANYAQSLDVYQRTCNQTGTTIDTAQGKFIWETLPYVPLWGVVANNSSTDPASYAYSVARVGIRNSKMGIVYPGEALYDPTTLTWNATMPPWTSTFRPPDRVQIRYRAGYPLDSNYQMDKKFQVAVARFAMSELDNRIAACDEAMRELARWQRDRSNTADKTEAYTVSKEDLNNPFGTRLGAIFAWHETKHLRLTRGVTYN